MSILSAVTESEAAENSSMETTFPKQKKYFCSMMQRFENHVVF
ncbi:hypothetical protein SAMN06297358_3627 [Pedobacter xixiisoli]|uniref:Uncharacterized protein n=1 Tax=Pedobacter xixiisoli TaxID=1476464 RepID=A0A286ADC7_9SPHI|nr:hypothetical protein SAMN06297358_3627 [Pedobacter xixiisoli]